MRGGPCTPGGRKLLFSGSSPTPSAFAAARRFFNGRASAFSTRHSGEIVVSAYSGKRPFSASGNDQRSLHALVESAHIATTTASQRDTSVSPRGREGLRTRRDAATPTRVRDPSPRTADGTSAVHPVRARPPAPRIPRA